MKLGDCDAKYEQRIANKIMWHRHAMQYQQQQLLPLPPLSQLTPFVCLSVCLVWLHVSAPRGVKSISWLVVSGARAPGWECRKLAVISAYSLPLTLSYISH